jgi:hypothetical protein
VGADAGQPFGEGNRGVLAAGALEVYQPGQVLAGILAGPDGLLERSRTRLVRIVVAARKPRIRLE